MSGYVEAIVKAAIAGDDPAVIANVVAMQQRADLVRLTAGAFGAFRGEPCDAGAEGDITAAVAASAVALARAALSIIDDGPAIQKAEEEEEP